MTYQLTRLCALMMCLLASVAMYAGGRVVGAPKFYYSSEPRLVVVRVELSDTATVLSLRLTGEPNSRLPMAAAPMLRDDAGRMYACKGGEGIVLGGMNWLDDMGTIDFALSFQPLPMATRMFDFASSLIHKNRIVVLGIAANDDWNAHEAQRRYGRSDMGQYLQCSAARQGSARISGSIIGYNAKAHPLSIYLCEQSVMANENSRVVASCRISSRGTFALDTNIERPGVYVLATEQGDEEWLVPVFVHQGDYLKVAINLNTCKLAAYSSTMCKANHLPRLQSLALLSPDQCVPSDEGLMRFSLETIEPTPVKGRQLVEKIARKYRGKYVEFVGLNSSNATSTLNQLANLRYDYYRHPDLKIVYLFNGRNFTREYYNQFVEQYMQGEDCHLMTTDDYAAVREYMLSRQPALVGTLNRHGIPFLYPLDYSDEFEFRRRFRMMLKSESMSESEAQALDTMVEVPDTLSIIYDRERTAVFQDDDTVLPTYDEQKQQSSTWPWLVAAVAFIALMVVALLVAIKRRRNSAEAKDVATSNAEPQPMPQVETSVSDQYISTLIAAWVAKKPKNGPFLSKLQQECPDLTMREQAMCLMYYSEDLPDDKVMQLLEIPSSSAFRTAKSRLRKKLNSSNFNLIRI